MQSILVVEDDVKIASYVSQLLRNEGWGATVVASLAELNEAILSRAPDFALIILDRLLGADDTKAMIPRLHETWPSTPILVLSAINTPLERAELLNVGVDDYLGKPFLNQEFIARVRALVRRSRRAPETHRKFGNTVLDLTRLTLQVEGKAEEALPHKEFLLLRNLTREPGRVISREDLISAVWGQEASFDSNVLEATLTHLRRRLEALGSAIRVKNLRNAGYFVEI